MYEELFTVFRSIAILEKEEEEILKSSFKPLKLSKGDFFLRSGEINRTIGFLRRGLIRYFVYKNDEESTFEFTQEGEFVADYQSFNSQTSSIQNIQAIEDCEFLIIDHPSVQHIFNNTKHGNLIGRLILEHRFDVMVNQLLSIYMHNQEERYRMFVNKYFNLTQRIPQYLIASYVGVKPESLSRIRKRFDK